MTGGNDTAPDDVPIMRWRDIPLLLLLSPLLLLLGLHIYFAALGVRKLIPTPFIIIAAVLQTCQFTCVALLAQTPLSYVAAIAAIAFALALLPPLVFDDQEARHEGYSGEHFVMGHVPTVLAALILWSYWMVFLEPR